MRTDTLSLGSAGAKLIQSFEGCAKALPDGRFAAYPDPATGNAPWTIGWGSTGVDIAKGLIWTRDQCDARFKRDATALAARIVHLIGSAPTTQNQLDAIVALAYNIGAQNLAASILLTRHNAGDFAGAYAQFARWNKANGVVMAGLTRRRAAEAELYAR